MPKKIEILDIKQEEDLEAFYHRVMDELDALYHNHPTILKYTRNDDPELLNRAPGYGGLDYKVDPNKPIGKQIV